MALNFPRQLDVRLERSPLTEVICQIRFPPILRIANEDPSQFQELVRREFPRFDREEGYLFQLQFSGASFAGPPAAHHAARLYRFRSTDEQTVITLSTEFYSVSTTSYTVWEDFSRSLRLAHEAMSRVYQPEFSVRIGLRYVDELIPSHLGLSTLNDVISLLRPELTSMVQTDAWNMPTELLCQLLLEDSDGKLGLRFGTKITSAEPVFVLDFDYFDEMERPFSDVEKCCDKFHTIIYDAFRWCIMDEGLDVFRPVTEES
jgi:uncharacterized protein (TIGR04255 family)